MELYTDDIILIPMRNVSSTMIDEDYESKWKIIRIVFTSGLIIFTVFGNGMTLYGVCKMKSFRNSISNLYIASLAAADLIVGAFVMTFMMLYSLAFDEQWVFGRLFCDIWQIVDFICCTISLYSVCAIGFDRWLNLEKPLRMFKRSKYIARRAIFGIWILPVVLWVPIVITLRLMNGPPVDLQCNIHWKPKMVTPLIAAPIFYLPVLMLSVLFVRISFVIRAHLNFLHNHSNRSLLDLDNRSLCKSDKSENNRSPSLTPIPGFRGKPLAAAQNGQSFKQVYKPSNLNFDRNQLPTIPQDHSSKATHTDGHLISGPHSSRSLRDRSGTLPSCNGNQSPLAIQVMKDRLSPSPMVEQKGLLFPNTDRLRARRSSDSGKSKASSAKNLHETTPLLAVNGSMVQSNSAACKLNVLEKQNRSASRDSVYENKLDPSLLVPGDRDRKRSSISSDTAVVITKRLLLQKPPLLRARTDVALEIQHAAADRKRSTRFSIISITGPLFNRRYSVNIFSDMLPCPSTAQQIRAAKAVGVLMLFFLICWLPYLILWPLKTYCNECVSDSTFRLSIWANYLNSTINPVLYTLCSPRFQRVFRENCRCACKLPRKKHANRHCKS